MPGYDPLLDFFSLLRPSTGSQLVRRMPILDLIIKTLGDAGLVNVYVGYSAPSSDQTTTAWLLPQNPSWQGPGVVMLWDTSQNGGLGGYMPATPSLFWAMLQASGIPAPPIGPPAPVVDSYGGFINKFRNGTMAIWQRGSTVTAPTPGGGLTADGWQVNPAGANVQVNRVPGRQLTRNALQIQGTAGNTGITVFQRIESYACAPLSGQLCTVQGQLYNGAGVTITPQISTYYPSSPDSFSSGSIAIVTPTPIQPCPPGQWTQIAFSFQNPVQSNGLQIDFILGNNFGSASQTVLLTEFDIRATPGVALGINMSPPPPELRPYHAELQFCQRYFWRWQPGAGSRLAGAAVTNNELQADFGLFPTQMRTLNSVTDGNLSDLLIYDGVGGNGAPGASAFAAFSNQGYGYVNYTNIAGNPLTPGHAGFAVSTAGLYHIDFNGEIF